MIHRASAPVGRTQSCAICGTVLVDHSSSDIALGPFSSGFSYFPKGASIDRGPQHVVITIHPPNCCPPVPESIDETEKPSSR